MASATVVKNMGVSHFLFGKNMYDVLSIDDIQVEKKVHFADRCFVNCDGDMEMIPTKTWDGPSPKSSIYCELLYDFIYAHPSDKLTARSDKMSETIQKIPVVSRDEFLVEFIIEAEYTAGKLADPDGKKVPLWGKGGGGKKGGYSFPPSTATLSLQWVNLFIKTLREKM